MRSFCRAVMLCMTLLANDVSAAEKPVQGGAPAPEALDQPAAVVPAKQPKIEVELHDDILSVDLLDAEFGSIMHAIAAKAGIRVELAGEVRNRKITTKFSHIDLERGILRLMTLVNEKNYTIKYDSKGGIDKVEVYGGTAAASLPSAPRSKTELPKTVRPGSVHQPSVSGIQKNPPQQRRLILSPKASDQKLPSTPPADNSGVKNNGPEDDDEMPVGEDLPYIPPQRKK